MNIPKPNSQNSTSFTEACFISLLKTGKIEKALLNYVSPDFSLTYNGKTKGVEKSTWINFIRRKILNPFTTILQFKIVDIETLENNSSFNIFLICKGTNGLLSFSEIYVSNFWENNMIKSTDYRFSNH